MPDRKPAALTEMGLWKIYLFVGGGGSPVITSTIRSNGLLLGTVSTSGKVGFPGGLLGIEAEHHAPPAWLATSLLVQRSGIDVDGDTSNIMTFGAMGKVIRPYGDALKFWVGAGAGLSTISLGGATTVVANGYRSSIEPNGTGFMLMARAGATYRLTDNLNVGAFVGRTGFSTTLNGSVTNISTGASAPLDYEFTAGWWDTGLRFGFDF